MKSHRALAVLEELRSLAAHDQKLRAAAKDRLTRAAAEMAAARSAFDSADVRAEVSRRVVSGAEELLPEAVREQTTQPGGARPAAPQEPRPTIAREVLAFLRLRGSAAREEIIQHIETARPDIALPSLRREMNRMVTRKTLALAHGVYTKAPTAPGGDV